MTISIFRPHWPALVVTGEDAASWLNAIITCDVVQLKSGMISWGALLSKQGKVQADLRVQRLEQQVLLAVAGGDAAEVLTSLDGFLVMEDAEIASSSLIWVLVADADSAAVSELCGAPAALWAAAGLCLVALSEQQWLSLSASSAVTVEDDAWWNSWRIEHAIPAFGVEYGSSDNLHAAHLEQRVVDWSKGCYLGQEVVCMQEMRGKVKSRLVQLQCESEAVAQLTVGDALLVDGTEVGKVASVAGKFALARLSSPHYASGTSVVSGDVVLSVVG